MIKVTLPWRLCRPMMLKATVEGSVTYVAQRVAYKMMEFYPGNRTNGIPGLFDPPYYWWEAGAVFGVSGLNSGVLK